MADNPLADRMSRIDASGIRKVFDLGMQYIKDAVSEYIDLFGCAGKSELGWVAGASFYGRQAPGTSRLVVDVDREVVVGATFTGPDVAEFLHAATIAIVAEVPIATLRHAVPSFPTRSEVWLRLLEAYEAETRGARSERLAAAA